jgi:ABC-type lipoprotein export system ATPase subunit
MFARGKRFSGEIVDEVNKSNPSIEVLKDFNLSVKSGEFIAVVGPSGSGKSTLLHILGGLDRPDSGKIYFKGEDIFLRRNTLDKYRNKNVGFVFQHYYLLADFTALENISLPNLIGGYSFKKAYKKAMGLLERLNLSDRLGHYPSQLSGGEQQRVAIGRALINEPELLLADEPTGNLDRYNSENVVEILTSLKDSGITIIIATHDESIAAFADRIIHLEKR